MARASLTTKHSLDVQLTDGVPRADLEVPGVGHGGLDAVRDRGDVLGGGGCFGLFLFWSILLRLLFVCLVIRLSLVLIRLSLFSLLGGEPNG